jgi:hypothetical protein
MVAALGYSLTTATAKPSISTVAGAFRTKNAPCTIAEVAAREPLAALTLAMRASPPRSAKRGNAVAAKIPKITMTTINSINVKPDCFCVEYFCIEFSRFMSEYH